LQNQLIKFYLTTKKNIHMRKTAVILMMILLTTSTVFAQRSEVRRANRNLSRGVLDEAKTNIENAIKDESTKNDPATWVLKSKIFMEISVSENPEYKNLAENPLDIAQDAIKTAKELDKDNRNLLDIQQTLLVLSEFYYNAGAIAYNDKQYLQASHKFENAFEIGKSFGALDTATLYNAGLAAEVGRDLDRAINIYTRVAEMDYDQPFLYSSLASIETERKNYDEATKWITIGREKYPDNLDLIFSEANVYLSSGNIPEARRVLQLAIDKDPDNANLHYAFAVNYDQMSRDTTFTKSDREYALNESIKSYQKAIELNPNYFDAIYNLGALHFNEGIRLFVEAEEQLRKDMNFREYEKKEERVKAKWLEAQPYLEKSFQMIQEDDPNMEIVLRSLRELYLRTNQEEKFAEVNEIWNRKFAGQTQE
jgi:tetratricopeptide (TPR) repeat protein